MSDSIGRGGDWPIPDAPPIPTLRDRAREYRAAKANPGDWRAIANARGGLLGIVTADKILELVGRADDLDKLLAIIDHGDPLEIATAALNLGGRR